MISFDAEYLEDRNDRVYVRAEMLEWGEAHAFFTRGAICGYFGTWLESSVCLGWLQ